MSNDFDNAMSLTAKEVKQIETIFLSTKEAKQIEEALGNDDNYDYRVMEGTNGL